MGGRPSAVRVNGPLAPHVAGFRRELERLGYRPHAVCDQLRLMAHVSRRLDAGGWGAEELTSTRVEEFLVHRRAEGYTLWLSTRAMVPMLVYLRALGVVPTPAPAAPQRRLSGLRGSIGSTWSTSVVWRLEPWPATCMWPGCSARCALSTVSCILIG
jgi:hypothetical protein